MAGAEHRAGALRACEGPFPRVTLSPFMSLRVLSAELLRHDLRARLPFRYGIVTMVEVPHVVLRLEVEAPAGRFRGLAADHLPPKWFTKDPSRAIAGEIDDLLAVVTHAASAARDVRADSAFAFWLDLKRRQAAWGAAAGHPPLLAQFGTSLVERALLEALARSQRTTLGRLLRGGALGVRLGDVHPELRDVAPESFLPADPPRALWCRHTVGMLDPLAEEEIAPGSRIDDGLPQSLEAGIAAYGLRHFKLKIDGGQPEAARERLRAILRLLEARAPADHAFSIDGNESFASMEAFREFWGCVMADPLLRRGLDRLLFVEQPLARKVALDPETADLRGWADRPVIIIDESDAEPEDVRRALALGYAGTSHKNCKGVFKGVAHAGLMAQRRAATGGTFVHSGEDLSNIGPVALPQDLAVQAILGITSVERNGHHYFAGLSPWPAAVQEAALAAHPDLYHRSPRGWPTLSVTEGRIAVDSVLAAPLGVGAELALDGVGTGWRTIA